MPLFETKKELKEEEGEAAKIKDSNDDASNAHCEELKERSQVEEDMDRAYPS